MGGGPVGGHGYTVRVMKHRQALGALGERIAERWLVGRGWSVLSRRFRSGHRDIDLVVIRGETVAFVEVKTRRSAAYGGPGAAVGWRKRRELSRSAQVWVARHGRAGWAYRFDVVEVLLERVGSGERRVRLRRVADAFPVHGGGGAVVIRACAGG